MRKGELTNLEWEDVRLDLGVILIRPKETWQPRSNERVIPISPALYQVIAEEWQERRSDRWWSSTRPATAEGDEAGDRSKVLEEKDLEEGFPAWLGGRDSGKGPFGNDDDT